MTPQERRTAFAQGFYEQASSDWAIYELLSSARRVERCHPLHYLQMATEKIAKAYRIRDVAADVDELARHHSGFAPFVNQFMNSDVVRNEYRGRDAARESKRQQLHRLAEQVERLAPAIDNLATPENAEYPWQRGDTILVPCRYQYPALNFLTEPSGLALLNLVSRAIRDYDKIRIV